MRGRILFRHGPHVSRLGYRALPTAKDEAEFRQKMEDLFVRVNAIVAPFTVKTDAFRALNIAILLARAEAKKSTSGRGAGAAADTSSRVTRDDRIAQLQAVHKISDDAALVDALRNIDDRTLAAIDAESQLLIAEEINKHGSFVDVDGDEFHFPVSMEIPVFVPRMRRCITLPEGFDGLREELAARGCDTKDPAAVIAGIEALNLGSASSPMQIELRPDSPVPAYLPLGVAGLRKAVEKALDRALATKVRAGNLLKIHQRNLAQACRDFWRATIPEPFRGRAWQTGQGSKVSKLLEFSTLVFASAGFFISPITLVEVMNKPRGN